nr:uncharacterized protein LOC117274382 [Nicotiana tomentosiformis]
MFQEHLGKTMKVYIDDMLVKSTQAGDHFQHLSDTFEILRKYNMKLNPKQNALLAWLQELSGRLTKWAIELSEYDIIYQPRTTIKSQVLADFSMNLVPEAEKKLQVFTGANSGTWTVFTNGSSNVKGAGLGIVLIPPSGEDIRQAIKCYPITNNEAEYEVVIAGLELAQELGIEYRGLTWQEKRECNNTWKKVRELLRQFQSWKAVHIPREENSEAAALANLACVMDVTNTENTIAIHLFYSALDQDKSEYGILPEDKKKSQLLRQKAAWYCLIRGNLYQKIFGGPLARCLGPSQTEYVIREVHERYCGIMPGEDHCMHRPAELLHSISSPWPFMKWGMDIVGSLPQAKGKIKRITSAPYHHAANGQAKSTNKVIINNLKKILEESKSKWPEVLPGVLWAYRTTTKTSTGETPFALVYGAEVLIPVDIGEPMNGPKRRSNPVFEISYFKDSTLGGLCTKKEAKEPKRHSSVQPESKSLKKP